KTTPPEPTHRYLRIEAGRLRAARSFSGSAFDLRGEAADLDRGGEDVIASLTPPAVQNDAFLDEGGTLRYELLVIALRAKRAREIARERQHCGRSIQLRH